MKQRIRETLMGSGAAAVGFADASQSQAPASSQLENWLIRGYNAGMDWISRHADLRENPENILPGAKSVIVAAFPYGGLLPADFYLPSIARYAHFYDYHYSLKTAVDQALKCMMGEGQYRICIDSAPMAERYWAKMAGIGYIGDNGALIVPGIGCEVFLVEILTTESLLPDNPLAAECRHCGKCLRSCPAGALHADGTVDCRRCLSYLTIEHHGPWESDEALEAMASPTGKETLFGCDRCISCCPMNQPLSPELVRSSPIKVHPSIFAIKEGSGPASKGEFKRMFKNSPISRCDWEGWKRNSEN